MLTVLMTNLAYKVIVEYDPKYFYILFITVLCMYSIVKTLPLRSS